MATTIEELDNEANSLDERAQAVSREEENQSLTLLLVNVGVRQA